MIPELNAVLSLLRQSCLAKLTSAFLFSNPEKVKGAFQLSSSLPPSNTSGLSIALLFAN